MLLKYKNETKKSIQKQIQTIVNLINQERLKKIPDIKYIQILKQDIEFLKIALKEGLMLNGQA